MDTTPDKQPTASSVAIKYGFIGGLILVVYTFILMVSGLSLNKWLSNLGFLILIGAIIIAYKEYKQENLGYMSYGQGLGIGTLIAAIFGLMAGVFMWVYTTFVDPNYMASIMEQQRTELENRGLSDDQIDSAIAMGEKFQGPLFTIGASILLYVIFGFILSLIIAAFMKNARPEFD